jgi:hypothetical protein
MRQEVCLDMQYWNKVQQSTISGDIYRCLRNFGLFGGFNHECFDDQLQYLDGAGHKRFALRTMVELIVLICRTL